MSIDLATLSPNQFEHFVRDLFAAEFDTHVESFTVGPDQGIDLRFKNAEIIIQCKHITSSDQNLLSSLKKERKKEIIQQAKKYIIVTSRGLTPKLKHDIKELFSNVISEEDIYGKDDIEGLLARNNSIRKLYPQLWLGDRDELERMIGSVLERAIDNQTKIELEKIFESQTYLTRHPQHQQAIEKLRKNKSLIITGAPGIGKTSLAHMIIWEILQNSEYKFFFISSDINEGFQKLDDNALQIFLYDDFLGTNFLHDRLQNNKDRRISSFIEHIGKKDNKLAIFTTREYIYQQAYSLYKNIRENQFDYNKFVLNVEKYTLEFRALVFYNHLWHKKVPIQAIESLFEKETNFFSKRTKLMKILSHASYNPRIIATISSKGSWINDNNKFADNVIQSLNHPYELYLYPFKNELEDEQRSILIFLSTYPENSFLNDILSNVQEIKLFDKKLNYGDLENALKIIEGDFVHTNYSGKIVINFVNPGIRDFIHAYLQKNKSLLKIISENIFTSEQAVYLLQLEENNSDIIDNEIKEKIVKSSIKLLNSLSDNYGMCKFKLSCTSKNCTSLCKLIPLAHNIKQFLRRNEYYILDKLITQIKNNDFSMINNSNINEFISILIYRKGWIVKNINIPYFIKICLSEKYNTFDQNIFYYIEHLKLIADEYNSINIENTNLSEVAMKWIENHFSYLQDLDIDELENQASDFDSLHSDYPSGFLGLSFGEYLKSINELIEEKRNENEGLHQSDDESWSTPHSSSANSPTEEDSINTLFKSLLP